MSNKLKIYIIITAILATSLFIYLLPTIPDLSKIWFPVLFFIIISIMAEFIPVSLPEGGEITITFPIDFVVILVYGPALAMVVSAFSSIGIILSKENRRFEKFLFNTSQFSLTSGVAGLVYQYAGGLIGEQNFIKFIIPASLCAFAYCLVNSILVTGVLAIEKNINITRVYLINIKETLPSYLAEAPIGFIMSIIYVEIGILGMLLFFFPLLLARRSFELFTKMRIMYLNTIKALAAAIDAKDPYTHGHSERVSKMAVQLAKRLNFSEMETEYIEYASILHDIGKIGIEDSILQKKDRLTDEEFEKIKKHPVIGAGIIDSIEFLKRCSDTVLHHHEHYDGKGYPSGLKGEGIPKNARLLAIADAYDAMSSDRPYRKKLSEQEILEELKNESGKQFDPVMTKEFISLVMDKKRY
ncbi:MAG: HD-GYP domain-containing protein [Atribacterota bacterium]|nr:HD-GYP domain-containing protein [Atribacterota bacterium]